MVWLRRVAFSVGATVVVAVVWLGINTARGPIIKVSPVGSAHRPLPPTATPRGADLPATEEIRRVAVPNADGFYLAIEPRGAHQAAHALTTPRQNEDTSRRVTGRDLMGMGKAFFVANWTAVRIVHSGSVAYVEVAEGDAVGRRGWISTGLLTH